MKSKKTVSIALFAAVCIMLNFGGRSFANFFELPVWLDCFGTVLYSYGFGPACGAIVGFTTNIIFALSGLGSIEYCMVSVLIGIIVGISAKRGTFKTVFGTMSASVLITLVAIVVCVPLSLIFHDGLTNNVWGNGVVMLLREKGLPYWVCTVLGEFYVEFTDKVIVLFALLLVIRLRTLYRKRIFGENNGEDTPGSDGSNDNSDGEDTPGRTSPSPAETAAKVTATVLCAAALMFSQGMDIRTDAADTPTDYSDYVQTVYSSDNGLPCGEANDVAQTNDGILWIGTYAGLYRYNGSEFRWMSEYNSVRNVNCLYVDDEGRLWIGTNDNGLSISINESVSNTIGKDNGLPSDSIKCITQSSDGDYYIGTTESMAVITLSNGLKILNEIKQVHFAVTVTADSDGHAAAVTSDGRLFLMGGREIRDTQEFGSESEIFNCCTFSPDGKLYAGTTGSKIQVFEIVDDKLRLSREQYFRNLSSIQSITFTEEGLCFICADNGVGFLDGTGTYHDINTGEFNNSIDNMTVDYQGNLWFTSSRLGLLRLSESPFADVYRIYDIERKVVNTVAERDGKLYFGTDAGLDLADKNTKRQIQNSLTRMLSGTRIRCIAKDSQDNLWICTYGTGLVKVKPDNSTEVFGTSEGSFGNRVRVALELSDGRVVAAGDTGMSFIGRGGIEKTMTYGDGFSNTMILSLYESSDGALLAGSDGDGIAVIRDGSVARVLTRYDGLSSGVILRMVGSTDGQHVLIVTSNGLCIMDSDYRISTVSNFPYSNNYDIWCDGKGKLFVMSSAGIYVVNEDDVLNNTADMSYELLDSNRGMTASLTANSWNWCDEEGELYMSSDSGVYKMNLYGYSSKKRTFRLLVSSAKLDGVTYPVERGTELSIPRGTARIEIYPEVINFTTENPFVSYYLEGFDSKPTIITQRDLTYITYTNLPTGDYKFHLSVLDGSKENVLEESVYTISKEKQIYDNGWFIVYMLIVAMLAVAWFTWFIAKSRIQRTLALQRHQLELAERQVRMGNETILAIARTVDAKDENTSQHSQRVSEYSVMIAQELGFSKEEQEKLRNAALLHDIGKIGIPDRILNKPARLTDEEYAIMKTHVTRGAKILKDFTLIENVVDGALYHHEKYDGTGYVHGLKGEEIPLYGRIIGVADAFDAMTANRVYRKKLDFDFVIGELERCKGTQFDPKIADIMLKLIREGKIDFKRLYGSEVPANDE
ncbi:MAG: HD domain-containing protein [Ruminococcus sp.]|nr:HD domain-containing protein [Ruminococcus sp.]